MLSDKRIGKKLDDDVDVKALAEATIDGKKRKNGSVDVKATAKATLTEEPKKKANKKEQKRIAAAL